MLNNPNDKAKRRPVDALFGDDNAPALPNYVVEPPMPANQVTPPIQFDGEPVIVPTVPETTMPERQEPIELTSTPMRSEPLPLTLPTLSHTEDPRFLTLSFQIERLYDQVKNDLRDSPKLTEQCFDLLLHARQAYEQRDYAHAEYFIQATDAKLRRSAKSIEAVRHPTVIALWAWEIVAILLGGSIVAISYITGLTLFGLPINSDLLVLLRTLGWGMVGGVFGAMTSLPRSVQDREYDPQSNMNYFAHPFIGLLIGAVLFVISEAGILAGNVVIGDLKIGPIFLYVFAALAGFKQEYVVEFFDGILKAVFRKQNSK
ncbi:MAG: hypothetical protein HZB51_14665 [Chloroflexi bacterium]|nr:hypothetical protein [Chloroflexota bacterium]